MSEDVQAQQKEPLMGADTTDRAQSLTTRLRHANKKQHRCVPLSRSCARSGPQLCFIGSNGDPLCRISDGLVAGKMAIVCTDGKLYARALACFWSVHVAIEEAVAKLADLPELRPLADLLPRLSRKKAFEEDLQFWIGCVCVSLSWHCTCPEQQHQVPCTVESKLDMIYLQGQLEIKGQPAVTICCSVRGPNTEAHT